MVKESARPQRLEPRFFGQFHKGLGGSNDGIVGARLTQALPELTRTWIGRSLVSEKKIPVARVESGGVEGSLSCAPRRRAPTNDRQLHGTRRGKRLGVHDSAGGEIDRRPYDAIVSCDQWLMVEGLERRTSDAGPHDVLQSLTIRNPFRSGNGPGPCARRVGNTHQVRATRCREHQPGTESLGIGKHLRKGKGARDVTPPSEECASCSLFQSDAGASCTMP
jgi:hypothetical protein